MVGTAVTVGPGEFVEANGTWVNDRSYGLQFRAEHLRVVPPSTLEGIEKYLGSGMIRGIGPHFAARLVRAFGAEVFEIIENDPDRLRELPGSGRSARARWSPRGRSRRRSARSWCSSSRTEWDRPGPVRIYRLYGDRAVDRVREDPYRLTLDVRGIGFRTADAIAQSLGFEADSIPRARAGVRHVLQELAGEGHCAGERGALVETTAGLLEVDAEVVEGALARDLADEEVVDETHDGDSWIYLPALHRSERGAAGHLGRLLGGGGRRRRPALGGHRSGQGDPVGGAAGGLRALGLAAHGGGLRHPRAGHGHHGGTRGREDHHRQRGAPHRAREGGVRARLCAPTGRAAKRLAESTGLEASTIHRLLEFDPTTGGFRHGRDQPLDTDLVVVDEVSMVDIVLANQLFRAIPDHAALLLVGDVDQLPSVGPGSVLADVIGSERVPTVRLTEIFRQAESSRIVVNAHRINRGESPEYPRAANRSEGEGGGEGAETAPGNAAPSDFYVIPVRDAEEARDRLLQVVTERIPRRFGFDPMADLQVLTPGRRGGLGATALNAELQSLLNPGSPARVNRYGTTYARGDKVLQTVNDYQKEVFNGDIGRIVAVDPEEQTVTVDFEGRPVPYEFSELDELSLAYAITVHKSQGSEFPAVVIPLTTQHYMLLERNLVYTGVTRGKRLVVLVAEPRALAIAVRRFESVQRRSRLAERLRGDI